MCRKGAAAVEFAIVLPLILLLFFTMVEFCSAILTQSKIHNIARESARHAITPSASNSSVEAVADKALQAANINSGSVTGLPVDIQTVDSGTVISVTVVAPSDENSIGLLGFFRNFDFNATVAMRKE